jgi:hypothetical protein
MSNHSQSQEKSSRLVNLEDPRDYRTEIPNIIYAMLEARILSLYDLALYYAYKKIAGDNGACWCSTRTLKKQLGMSDKTITKSKKRLSTSLETLAGKSLIEIHPGDRKKEEADTIYITNIWSDNYNFFKNKLTCSKTDGEGCSKSWGEGCSKNDDTRTNSLKKEPYEEESNIRGPKNVHNSQANGSTHNPQHENEPQRNVHKYPTPQPEGREKAQTFHTSQYSVAPPPTQSLLDMTTNQQGLPQSFTASQSPSGGSLLFHKEIPKRREDKKPKGFNLLEQINSPDLEALLALTAGDNLKPYFREHVITGWLRKWGPGHLLKTIHHFLKIIQTQKKPIENYEAWMESAFVKNYVEIAERVAENKAFAQKIKKQYDVRDLKINMRYCGGTRDVGTEFYYDAAPKEFQEALTRFVQWIKERNG